jgi:hypothetical protein
LVEECPFGSELFKKKKTPQASRIEIHSWISILEA